MDLAGVIKALKEMDLYPPRIPEFFIRRACEVGIKMGLITLGEDMFIDMFIPRYTISDKGLEALGQEVKTTGAMDE